MNKQKFNNVVSNPENITSEDRANLKSLAENYPYSQIIHSLIAKAYASEKGPEYKKVVGTAAMYTTDRHVLKDLVTSIKKISDLKSPAAQSTTEHVDTRKDESKVKKPQTKVNIDTSSFYKDSELLRAEIWKDLEKLKLSKEHYLESLEHSIEMDKKASKTTPKKTTTKSKATSKKTATKKSTTQTKKTTPKTESKQTPSKKTTADSKTTAKAKLTTKTSSSSSKAVKPPTAKAKQSSSAKTKNKRADDEPEISEQRTEIKATLKEQITIINSFIDKEPSISTRSIKTVASDQKDLSEKSTNFGDDLISENLAQILVEQGKSQKAIDMYKKLIWKFPQKKAYFAARIEDLTK